jgi:hypothetical protein
MKQLARTVVPALAYIERAAFVAAQSISLKSCLATPSMLAKKAAELLVRSPAA